MGERAAIPAARASAADRERVAERLRVACVDERLSLETFVGRLELAYTARTRAELASLVADLGEPGSLSRALLSSLERTAQWLARARDAWRRPVIPLRLPSAGAALVGRSRACDVVLADEFVSRRHAVLRRENRHWTVEDCGSRNGTWVNGRRVECATSVRPGDILTFAGANYRLAAPRDPG